MWYIFTRHLTIVWADHWDFDHCIDIRKYISSQSEMSNNIEAIPKSKSRHIVVLHQGTITKLTDKNKHHTNETKRWLTNHVIRRIRIISAISRWYNVEKQNLTERSIKSDFWIWQFKEFSMEMNSTATKSSKWTNEQCLRHIVWILHTFHMYIFTNGESEKWIGEECPIFYHITLIST